jgi:fused signal recognition particle receptor
MAFNWFNRQFNESQAAAPESQPPVPPPEAESPPAAEQPAVAEDYLSWAKAAYQNIQKRQQSEPKVALEPAASESESPPSADSIETDTPVAEPSIAASPDAAPPAIELPTTAEVEDAEPIAATAAEPIALQDATAIAAESADATVPATPQLPFWAQAEADRQQRLERLKAEAVVEVTPEPAAAVAESVQTEASELALDDNFLWSAEVLASQGRRPEQVSIEEITWLRRLRQGLDKTRRSLVNQLRAIVGQGPLNQDAVLEIESLLLQADVGVEATDYIIDALQQKLRDEVLPPAEAIAYLKQILRDMLDRPQGKPINPTFAPEKDTLNIWLITGVNGAGKTTTIGKIAHIAQKSGYRTLIAAADTFRAAAVQQVKVWGDRSNVEVISNPGKNTDPAAVVFDAITAAQSRQTELLLVDTAGRLQNKKNLMDELSKIRRIIDKKAADARIESLLVLDATLGQNGLRQAEVFSAAAQLSGVVLTKLDGTARGGIALAVVQQLGLPIRFIGAGEGIEDLRPFSSYEFVEALLSG